MLLVPVPKPTALCHPSPCGPHSQCQVIDNKPVCSCLPGFIGVIPECRPECVISTECSSRLACIKQKCLDPCTGSCGVNTECRVHNHIPICTCMEDHTGDPFILCSPTPKSMFFSPNVDHLSQIILMMVKVDSIVVNSR